jgi:hypothetical protein
LPTRCLKCASVGGWKNTCLCCGKKCKVVCRTNRSPGKKKCWILLFKLTLAFDVELWLLWVGWLRWLLCGCFLFVHMPHQLSRLATQPSAQYFKWLFPPGVITPQVSVNAVLHALFRQDRTRDTCISNHLESCVAFFTVKRFTGSKKHFVWICVFQCVV